MKIYLDDVDLVKFVKEVYNLSVPQGFGFLHHKNDELTDEEAKDIIKIYENNYKWALDMDYVKGRACKMTVRRYNEKLYIDSSWYDHTDKQLEQLLELVGLDNKILLKVDRKHSIACNCVDCQLRRIKNEKNAKH